MVRGTKLFGRKVLRGKPVLRAGQMKGATFCYRCFTGLFIELLEAVKSNIFLRMKFWAA
jgi:hypothetical protein